MRLKGTFDKIYFELKSINDNFNGKFEVWCIFGIDSEEIN